MKHSSVTLIGKFIFPICINMYYVLYYLQKSYVNAGKYWLSLESGKYEMMHFTVLYIEAIEL